MAPSNPTVGAQRQVAKIREPLERPHGDPVPESSLRIGSASTAKVLFAIALPDARFAPETRGVRILGTGNRSGSLRRSRPKGVFRVGGGRRGVQPIIQVPSNT